MYIYMYCRNSTVCSCILYNLVPHGWLVSCDVEQWVWVSLVVSLPRPCPSAAWFGVGVYPDSLLVVVADESHWEETTTLRRRRERRAAESSEERETRLAKRRVADRARYAANSDGRTERRRERRAAESSEQRETRLARRRVADRARFAAISR